MPSSSGAPEIRRTRERQRPRVDPLRVLVADLPWVYGTEGSGRSPGDVPAFRAKTRLIYTTWIAEIGPTWFAAPKMLRRARSNGGIPG